MFARVDAEPGVVFVDHAAETATMLEARLPRSRGARLGFADGWVELPDPAEWRFWIWELLEPAPLARDVGAGSSWHETLTLRSVHGPTDLAEAVHDGAKVFLFLHEPVLAWIHRRDYRYNPLYWLGEKLVVERTESARVVEVDGSDPVARRLFGADGPRLELPLRWGARVEGGRSLARTASGRTVACRLDRGKGSVYLLPAFDRSEGILERMALEFLPETHPEAFPDGEVRDWIDEASFDGPSCALLRTRRRELAERWRAEDRALEIGMAEARRADAAARGLLHGATDEEGLSPPAPRLVDCLATALEAFGFDGIAPLPGPFPGLVATSPEGETWRMACLACRGALDPVTAGRLLAHLGDEGPRLALLNPWRCRDARRRPHPLGLAPLFEDWRRRTGGTALTSLALFALLRALQGGDMSAAQGRERLVAGDLRARLDLPGSDEPRDETGEEDA